MLGKRLQHLSPLNAIEFHLRDKMKKKKYDKKNNNKNSRAVCETMTLLFAKKLLSDRVH